MISYELMYILPAKLEKAERQVVSGKLDSLVKEAGGAVVSHNEWLTRKLSYPMQHTRQGTFVLAQVNLPGDAIPALRRELELDEAILRHQLVKIRVSKKATRPRRAPKVLPQEALSALSTSREAAPAETEVKEEVSPEQLEQKLEELLSEDKPVVK